MSLRERTPGLVKRSARAMVAVAGTVTAHTRSVPDFLIAGAQRCGTTSVHRMLAGHPAVVAPLLHKGVHYFDTAGHYARGFDWYRGHFPLRRTLERRSHLMGTRAVTGESSPYYLFHPLAAARIGHGLPSVRIIVLLRDPVERAFSAHKQESGRGFEQEPFERALELEPHRLAGEEERIVANPGYQSFAHQHHAYVGRGEYAAQLERLFAATGRDRVLVIDVGDLFGDGFDEQWSRLLDFLGLPAWAPQRPLRANAQPGEPMPARIRDRLSDHFRTHDERLANLMGAVPSWRRDQA